MKKAEIKFKDTLITEIKDDVFRFSIKNADCGLYWIKSGFTGLHVEWWAHFFKEIKGRNITVINENINKEISYNEFISTSPRIFTHERYRMYKINPKIENLEYVYLHPNIRDDWSNPREVPNLIIQALNEINKHGIRTVAMNGIQATRGNEKGRRTDEFMAHEMIRSIELWLNNNNTSLETIYLVDNSNDGFGLSTYTSE